MPRSSRSRDSSSRRSRSSSSRSRSRHSHRDLHRYGHSINSHLRHLYRLRQKQKEKNFLAAVCSMISVVILCTALAEPKWISLRGGGCILWGQETPLGHLGAYQFFYPGTFAQVDSDEVYKFGPSVEDQMYNCVTYKGVALMKAIIAFTLITILSTLLAFALDLIGPSHRSLKILRRNAILNIASVIMCVIINMFCYWLTVEVQLLQKQSKFHKGSKIYVTFDISFYLVAAAGGVGVLATAFNCLRRYSTHDDNPSSEALLDDYDGMEEAMPPTFDASPMENMPPPPAYCP